jgi:hypothetical protein
MNHAPAAFGAEMTNIHDSPAWDGLHGFMQADTS